MKLSYSQIFVEKVCDTYCLKTGIFKKGPLQKILQAAGRTKNRFWAVLFCGSDSDLSVTLFIAHYEILHRRAS
jgi:hypothetical protein